MFIRLNNVALLQTYGSNAWKIQNFLLESTAKELEKELEAMTDKTTEVNRARKQFQVSFLKMASLHSLNTQFNVKNKLGAQLTSLETRWTELISNILQIELANTALEAEISELSRKETELSAL